MSSKGVSPSTIDCICCSLGAIALLWISTLATALGDLGDVDSVVVAQITLYYGVSPVDSANAGEQKQAGRLSELWRLNGRQLADFYLDGRIVPRLESWPPLAEGSLAQCSFAPEAEQASESVSFISLAPYEKDGKFAWTRVICVQQRRKGESVTVGIDFLEKMPVDVEATVTINGKTLRPENEADAYTGFSPLQIVADGDTVTIRPGGEGK